QLAQIQRLGSAAQAARDPESFRPPAFIEPVERLGAAERGTAYHTVMEHIPFTPEGKEPGDISAFIERLVSSSILTPAESRAVDPVRISEFFSSDIGRRVLASPRVMKEAPFTVKRIYEGREIMVQGTLDCCFMEDGSWVLVDYKSNYVDKSREEDEAERLKNEYIPQLAQYRYALESITGIPVKEAVLYLFGLGKGVTVR
ncbi:MAG: PD-(D/E)XK nuclease family protein, partial [Firmicutes bacterium]|nr:PD-(D/E)XK nuclease family protein [Bacillota bacterium]